MAQGAEHRQGRHVVSALHVHLVFVTKYRSNVFDDAMLRRCEDIMIEVCDSFEAELREFTGQVNRAILHGPFWSPSYFAASCGGAPLSIIKAYVEQQRRPT